jgi:hypothetical protein
LSNSVTGERMNDLFDLEVEIDIPHFKGFLA